VPDLSIDPRDSGDEACGGWRKVPNASEPALTREEVGKLLSDTRLDAQMKAFAQRDDFQSGKGGVNS
jgi:hypothetical protein